ncbi:hypothetical protein BV898_09725 [Hypsibius exemplaris]|uniref:Bulb-type lectin domain-containing protein n=1 Tax=Hypsibius exemplaris TaxID=2072580 RepID=A0A1W0WLM0_HYPEX|nr:hypothetical protein BV898_09725 [Hypsibius exemplaris]
MCPESSSSSAVAFFTTNSILPGHTLEQGTILWSGNKSAKLILQADGNLVVYRVKSYFDEVATWVTGTSALINKPTVVALDSSRELQLLSGSGDIVWKLGSGQAQNACIAGVTLDWNRKKWAHGCNFDPNAAKPFYTYDMTEEQHIDRCGRGSAVDERCHGYTWSRNSSSQSANEEPTFICTFFSGDFF